MNTFFKKLSFLLFLLSLTLPQFHARPIIDHATENSKTTLSHVSHYTYIDYHKRRAWPNRPLPMNVTYRFTPNAMIHTLRLTDIKDAVRQAFSRWSEVIPVSFLEQENFTIVDISIGFYRGNHGDGFTFDSTLLAHAAMMQSTYIHFNADITWAVDIESARYLGATDLESVAVHEIGHVLGLGHSSKKSSIMYAYIDPMKKKVELTVDDVEGVLSLYGPNPNFNITSFYLTHSRQSIDGDQVILLWILALLAIMAITALLLHFLCK